MFGNLYSETSRPQKSVKRCLFKENEIESNTEESTINSELVSLFRKVPDYYSKEFNEANVNTQNKMITQLYYYLSIDWIPLHLIKLFLLDKKIHIKHILNSSKFKNNIKNKNHILLPTLDIQLSIFSDLNDYECIPYQSLTYLNYHKLGLIIPLSELMTNLIRS